MKSEETLRLRIEANIKKYGSVGSKIPGSCLYRSYCDTCGEPIRVTEAYMDCFGNCSHCRSNEHPGYGSPHSTNDVDEDANGGWSNVVKALDGD